VLVSPVGATPDMSMSSSPTVPEPLFATDLLPFTAAAAAAAAALASICCIARKSSRWFPNVFCDWRIFLTLPECFPCAVESSDRHVSQSSLLNRWRMR
jgi:hypothetical protein